MVSFPALVAALASAMLVNAQEPNYFFTLYDSHSP